TTAAVFVRKAVIDMPKGSRSPPTQPMRQPGMHTGGFPPYSASVRDPECRRSVIVRCLLRRTGSMDVLTCSFEEAPGGVDFGAVGELCDCGRGFAGPLAGDAFVAVPHEVDPQQWILVGVVQSCVCAAALAPLERAFERRPRREQRAS